MYEINRTANVLLYGEKIGVLTQDKTGFHFSYLPEYQGLALSLSLPVAHQTFHSEQLFPFFSSLIPEGWLKQKYKQFQQIDERDSFGLLLNNGKNLLGAVQILREE